MWWSRRNETRFDKGASLVAFAALPATVLLCLPQAFCAHRDPLLLTNDSGTPGDGKWEINTGLATEKFVSQQRSMPDPLGKGTTHECDPSAGLTDVLLTVYAVPPAVGVQAPTKAMARFPSSILDAQCHRHDSTSPGGPPQGDRPKRWREVEDV